MDQTGKAPMVPTVLPTTSQAEATITQVDYGLADLAASLSVEAVRRTEVVQRSQIGLPNSNTNRRTSTERSPQTSQTSQNKKSPDVPKKAPELTRKSQEATKKPPEPPQKPVEPTKKPQSTSPTRQRRFALEIWVQVQVGPNTYDAPDEDTISADFLMDVLNLVYPGCTGIYLADAGHMVAFYGRKGNPKGGLSSEQCVEAIKIMKELNSWMGEPAQWKIRAVSLQEANALVVGLKRLEKENLRRTRLELQRQLSSLRTASSLSADAKPFNPTTSSSADYPPPSGGRNAIGPSCTRCTPKSPRDWIHSSRDPL